MLYPNNLWTGKKSGRDQDAVPEILPYRFRVSFMLGQLRHVLVRVRVLILGSKFRAMQFQEVLTAKLQFA